MAIGYPLSVCRKYAWCIIYGLSAVLFLCGCDSNELNGQTAVRQSPDPYIVRVLLDDHITKAEFQIGSQYKILNPQSFEVFDVKKTSGKINIAPAAIHAAAAIKTAGSKTERAAGVLYTALRCSG